MLLSALFALGGCSGQDPAIVSPTLDLIGKSTQALSAGDVTAAMGTYASTCALNPSGKWSLVSSSGSSVDTTTWPTLVVKKDDPDCSLTLTDLFTTSDFTGSPTIALGTSYATTGSTFSAEGSAAFYANAELSAVTWGANFSMTVLFSDTLAATSPSSVNSVATVAGSSSVSESSVPEPNYTVDATGITVGAESNVVTAVAGNLALDEAMTGAVDGESYVVTTAAVTTTSFASVDSAFTGGAPVTYTPGSGVSIPATSLLSIGTSLSSPVTVTVIVRNLSNHVSSYQTFTVTFS